MDGVEIALAAREELLTATEQYTDTVHKLFTTYKKELDVLNVGLVLTLSLPGMDRLLKKERDFDKEDIVAQILWGNKNYVNGMVKEINEHVS